METAASYKKLIERLNQQVLGQTDALEELSLLFANESTIVGHKDQARQLDELQYRIKQGIQGLQLQESIASASFNEATLSTGLALLGAGCVSALLSRNGTVFAPWAKIAEDSFKRVKPFGTIIVAIGKNGIPDDVTVMSLSAQARELNTTEHAIRISWVNNGYTIMATGKFYEYLNMLRHRVLKGEATLPIAFARCILKPVQTTQL